MIDVFNPFITLFNCFFFHQQCVWKQVIANKCRNNRRRRDKNIPVVVAAIAKRKLAIEKRDNAMKEKDSEAEVIIEPRKKSLSAYGIINFLPCRETSEDNETIQKHIKLMTLESSKRTANPRVIDCGMQSTFADRRNLIVKERAPMSLVRETYPLLFNPYQVSLMILP